LGILLALERLAQTGEPMSKAALKTQPEASVLEFGDAEAAEPRRYSQYDDKPWMGDMISHGRHRNIVGAMWGRGGRVQLDFLKRVGLKPQHTVLDIGCGCLRAGVQLIRYLEPNHYYGIDSEKVLLNVGYRKELAKAGLQNRLRRDNLYCSSLFHHARLPEDSVDFGILISVITHLPFNFMRICLENTEKYFKVGGKLYVSFFEIEEGTRFAEPIERGDAVTTWGYKDPYHYYKRDMLMVAEGSGWRARYIGPWNHPRRQSMMEYERI
jgi:SAM-dependent methyltransferase